MSPCNAKVKLVYPTGHAVGLETEDGTVILIHCGIDTVNMKGEGFEVLVKEGQQVAAGDILVKFDKELVEPKWIFFRNSSSLYRSSDRKCT